jgi:hypothetical protein
VSAAVERGTQPSADDESHEEPMPSKRQPRSKVRTRSRSGRLGLVRCMRRAVVSFSERVGRRTDQLPQNRTGLVRWTIGHAAGCIIGRLSSRRNTTSAVKREPPVPNATPHSAGSAPANLDILERVEFRQARVAQPLTADERRTLQRADGASRSGADQTPAGPNSNARPGPRSRAGVVAPC